MRMPIPATLAALLGLLMLSGCSYRSYQEGTTKYRSLSVLTGQSVAPFKLEAGKENDPSYRKLESKGLTNDGTAIVEAAVTAAVKAAKQ